MSYYPSQFFSQSASVTVANTTTETTLVGAGVGSKVIKASAPQIGQTWQGIMMGIHSAVSNPNITINVKLGSTTICSTGVVASGSSTNAYFEVRILFTYRTLGASGTLFCQGYYHEEGGGASFNEYPMANTTTTTIDTTSDQTIDITVIWGQHQQVIL